MLGMFLCKRKYQNLAWTVKLSLLKMVFLPDIGVMSATLIEVAGMGRAVLVLILSMPVALSMIVLSDTYDFHKETIASVILVSSLSVGIYGL
jgi:predicted permease